MPRRAEKGMTLVETLVALAILSGVVIAVYAMIGQSVRFAANEQERLIASILADNRMIALLLQAAPPERGDEETPIDAAGRSWVEKTSVVEAGEGVLRLSVTVARADDGQSLARVETLRRDQ